MATIEFFGTGELEMTFQLTRSIERFVKYHLNLCNEWNFIGTNTTDAIKKDHRKNVIDNVVNDKKEPIFLSIPVYFQREEQFIQNNDPFYSFDKIIIGEKNKAFVPELLKILCEKAEQNSKVILEKMINVNGVNLKVLNIQCGNIDYWDKKLEESFNVLEKTFYIFYWDKKMRSKDEGCIPFVVNTDIDQLKKIKNEYEIKDKVWGYSKFLRDFLKIKNNCYELNIFEIKQFDTAELKNLLEFRIKEVEDIPNKTDFISNSKKILNDFQLKYNNDFTVLDLARLHLYNRNIHFQSDYFEIKFPSFIVKSTGSAHQILQKKDDLLLKPSESNNLGGLESKLFFYDLFKNITDTCVYFKKLDPFKTPDFLFLDDVAPNKLNIQYKNKYGRLHDWFPESGFYYSDNRNFLNEFFNLKTKEKVDKFSFIPEVNIDGQENIREFQKKTPKPLFIGIDIDWNGEQYGFELLKQFRRNVNLIERPCFIFVFSRYEYPSTIRKSVSSGALFYITKQNYINLVPKVFIILRYMDAQEIIHPKYRTYENWHLINKLEPAKVVQLKSQVIKGFAYKSNNNIHSEKIQQQWKWIQKLPKAELHCHIGSCLGPDLLPLTALLVLAEKYEKNKTLQENIGTIIKYIKLLVVNLTNDGNKIRLKDEAFIDAFGIRDKKYSCVFELLTEEAKLKENLIFPEVVLLSPDDSVINRLFPNIDKSTKYFTLMDELRAKKIIYDDLMLFFILFIYLKERNILSKESLRKNLFEDGKKIFPFLNEEKFDEIIINLIFKIDKNVKIPDIERFINELQLNESTDAQIGTKNIEILKHLQTSKGKSDSLFTYLRGCEYGGAVHLQTIASILISCYYIVHRYAIPDNIRYLTLRCAVDGYAKSGIINQHAAMQALLKGFDATVKLASKKIHVDLILTGKRHKSIKEFDENVALALQYRNGLYLPKGFKEEIGDSFFKTKTKVVSFDLAGLEEGNRANKYLPQFLPLLKKCFPITIHAGEEDDHEAIWEAIYLVQSQRIGHALTLRNNLDLIELVRDRHIAIELCPLSNILTRKEGSYKSINEDKRNDKKEYIKSEYYPLRQYLMENLDVTINTDNPYVSGSTLTEEYLIAADLSGGLTKWEILRLIKNSFRSAAIPKEQKKLMMNEIDDEIYNLLLEETL